MKACGGGWEYSLTHSQPMSGPCHAPGALCLERTPIPIEQEAKWATVWTCWRRESFLPLPDRNLNHPACRYTDYTKP